MWGMSCCVKNQFTVYKHIVAFWGTAEIKFNIGMQLG